MEWTREHAITRLTPPRQFDLLRQAVAQSPGSASLLLALGWALAKDERFADAADAFRRAAALGPNAEALVGLGGALLATGDGESAAEAFSAALDLAPLSPDALSGRVRSLRRLGRRAEALAAAHALCEGSTPAASAELEFVVSELIQTGRAVEVLALLDRVLAADPGASEVWYYRALALAALGRRAEAAQILDLRLIRIVELQPSGSDLGAFNAAVQAEIRASGSMVYAPFAAAARKAYRVRAPLSGNPPALTALAELVKAELERYAEACAADGVSAASPPPARARLLTWATLFGSEGHEVVHIHRKGWVSAVYYVAAPPPDATGGRAGVLRVPATARSGAADGEDWPVIDVEPRPGRLVMFPSYFPHCTVATGSEAARISVAFDVVPVPAAAAR